MPEHKPGDARLADLLTDAERARARFACSQAIVDHLDDGELLGATSGRHALREFIAAYRCLESATEDLILKVSASTDSDLKAVAAAHHERLEHLRPMIVDIERLLVELEEPSA